MAPDFDRLKKALLLQGEPDRVPLCETGVDEPVKQAFLGRPILTLADDVEFWATAGYDFIPLSFGLRTLLGPDLARKAGSTIDGKRLVEARYGVSDTKTLRAWAVEGQGAIRTRDDFDRFPWPRAEDLDYSSLEEAATVLPPGMKVIAYMGYVFTAAWEMMGFERFCVALTEEPGLVDRLFDKIGQIQMRTFEILLQSEVVGAIWQPDDVAYTEGLMVAPKYLRKYVFPYYKEMGKVASARGIPYLVHSDGKLDKVMEDIIDCGFNAVNPFEPKAMDIVENKKRYGDRICLVGNIDLSYTLTRGTPEEVEAEVKERIRALAPGGGYCVSSSNSVTEYVPLENFNAMREATFKYGRYPIALD